MGDHDQIPQHTIQYQHNPGTQTAVWLAKDERLQYTLYWCIFLAWCLLLCFHFEALLGDIKRKNWSVNIIYFQEPFKFESTEHRQHITAAHTTDEWNFGWAAVMQRMCISTTSIVCIFSLLQNYLVRRTLCIDIIISHHAGSERTVCVTSPIKSELLVRKVRFMFNGFHINNGPNLIILSLDYIKSRDSVKFYYSHMGKRLQHRHGPTCTNTLTALPFNKMGLRW